MSAGSRPPNPDPGNPQKKDHETRPFPIKDPAAFEFGGPHTVRITRSLAYTAQNATLNLDAGETVIVEGGYATCDQAVADATNTIVSGTGGNADSVLEFELAGTATVELRRLQVRDGDDTSGFGGGVSQVGGTLRIDESIISNNSANVGGGIYSQDGALEIGANVLIRLNNASLGGGGVALNKEVARLFQTVFAVEISGAPRLRLRKRLMA